MLPWGNATHKGKAVASLRSRAEECIAATSSLAPSPETADIQRLVHELQLHQLELEAQNSELQQARDETAQELNKRTSIYRAIAHDFAQPMLALRLFIKALSDTQLDVDQKLLLERIITSANALAEISGTLSELANQYGHSRPPKLRNIAVGPLLKAALNDHLLQAQGKGLRVRLRSTLATAVSDPLLLRSMVSNLIANAVRYTGRGQILVGVRRSGQSFLRIEVWDTGVGIDQKHIPRIFDEFYQVGNPERNPDHGLGIGLALARRQAELLGVVLGVRSEPRKGSVFFINLPRQSAASPDPPMTATCA